MAEEALAEEKWFDCWKKAVPSIKSFSLFYIHSMSIFNTLLSIMYWNGSLVFIPEMAALGWDSDTQKFVLVLQSASTTVGTNQQIKILSQLKDIWQWLVPSFFEKYSLEIKQPVLPHTVMLVCVYAMWRFNNIIHHEEATFMQPICSLPCPQQPVINLCSESDDFSPHPHLPFL